MEKWKEKRVLVTESFDAISREFIGVGWAYARELEVFESAYIRNHWLGDIEFTKSLIACAFVSDGFAEADTMIDSKINALELKPVTKFRHEMRAFYFAQRALIETFKIDYFSGDNRLAPHLGLSKDFDISLAMLEGVIGRLEPQNKVAKAYCSGRIYLGDHWLCDSAFTLRLMQGGLFLEIERLINAKLERVADDRKDESRLEMWAVYFAVRYAGRVEQA